MRLTSCTIYVVFVNALILEERSGSIGVSGLAKIHELTRAKARRVRFRAWLWNGTEYRIHFNSFRVESRSTKYTLRLGGYNIRANRGVPGLCKYQFLWNSNQQFTTRDEDNDARASGNCALSFGGAGWWYNFCTAVSPNVKYCPSESCGPNVNNIKVRCLMGDSYSMKRFQIELFIDDNYSGRS